MALSRVLYVGGGTLGSVTPLLAVQEVLGREGVEGRWVGTAEGPERVLVESAGMEFVVLPSAKVRRYFSVQNVVDGFRFVAGVWRAFRILGAWRPDVVVSAGSFVAVPVVIAAWLRGVPVHMHQLDLVPGLANRLSKPFASSVSVSFPELVAKFSGSVMTGTPIRERFLHGDSGRAVAEFGLRSDLKPVVLVVGGGTGGTGLNSAVVAALPRLLEVCEVVHVTGKGKMVDVRREGYYPVEFLTDTLADCLVAASVVVTRAGIGSLTEMAANGRAMVIVPLPQSQQEENARYFAEKGAGVVVEEKDLDGLVEKVVGLVRNEGVRNKMGEAGKRLVPANAAERVAQLLHETGKKR